MLGVAEGAKEDKAGWSAFLRDREAARAKVAAVADKLRAAWLSKAAALVDEAAEQTLTYYGYPSRHWRSLKTNNPLERIIREIRGRTRVVGAFPDGESALMLVAARLRHIAGTKRGTRRYLTVELLTNPEIEALAG